VDRPAGGGVVIVDVVVAVRRRCRRRRRRPYICGGWKRKKWQLDGDLLLVEVVDEVGGLSVDVALADPPSAVVLVAGAHLAHVAGAAVPVAHVVVVPPRLAQEAEDGAEERRLASHGAAG